MWQVPRKNQKLLDQGTTMVMYMFLGGQTEPLLREISKPLTINDPSSGSTQV